jgi:hypothetical protein
MFKISYSRPFSYPIFRNLSFELAVKSFRFLKGKKGILKTIQLLQKIVFLFRKKIQNFSIFSRFHLVIHSTSAFDSKKQLDYKTYLYPSALYFYIRGFFPLHQEYQEVYDDHWLLSHQSVPAEELRNIHATDLLHSDNHETLRQWYLERLQGR